MKILLIGCNGQVGFELARSLLPLGEIVALNREQAELTNLAALRSKIHAIQPHVIVNAAAYTAVDKAETERDLAFLINAEVVDLLAKEARKLDALLIHYSTDYIFDGTKTRPYFEDDLPNPLNVYGESKLAGEHAIQKSHVDYLIFRTTWVFASRGNNFMNSILRLASEREELKIVADQIGAPTWARFIADATAQILRQAQQEMKDKVFESGIFNLTNGGETRWFDFANQIIELAKHKKVPLKIKIVKPISTDEYPTPAKRPANSRLYTEKVQERFGIIIPTWQTALKLCLDEKYER